MRASLDRLDDILRRIDLRHQVDALADLRDVLYEILEHLDRALPKEVESD